MQEPNSSPKKTPSFSLKWRLLVTGTVCAGSAFLLYISQTASTPGVAAFPAVSVAPVIPEERWNEAQSFIGEWQGRPIIAGNWSGRERPYHLRDNSLHLVIPESALTDSSIDLRWPTTLSDNELLIGTKKGHLKSAGEILHFDQRTNRLINLTSSPEIDSRRFCLHRASRMITWSEGSQQYVARITTGPDVHLEDHITHERAFSTCEWIAPDEFLATQKFKAGATLYLCSYKSLALACKELPTLKDTIHFVNFFLDSSGKPAVIALLEGASFRRPYYLSPDFMKLEEIPGSGQIEGDVLDYEGGRFRISFESRYQMQGTDEPNVIVNKVLQIGDDLYAIVTDGANLRYLARLHNNHWEAVPRYSPDTKTLIFPRAQEDSGPIQEIWLPVEGITSQKVQAFYYGPQAVKRVVLWWHGGPSENVSPRYNPYFTWLNQLGYGVLAVNYPGSTGRGIQFEREINLTTLRNTAAAAIQYLSQRMPDTQILSWSVSFGSAVHDAMIQADIRVAAFVEESPTTTTGYRRTVSSQRGIPYFVIGGTMDAGRLNRDEYDFVYTGGHDLNHYIDFIGMTQAANRFFTTIPNASSSEFRR